MAHRSSEVRGRLQLPVAADGPLSGVLEKEPCAELYLARVPDTGHEVGGLPEIRAPGVAGVAAAKVCRVEKIETFDEYADFPVASASQVEELRRPKVHEVRRI